MQILFILFIFYVFLNKSSVRYDNVSNLLKEHASVYIWFALVMLLFSGIIILDALFSLNLISFF